jgi:hypothetical protein
VARAVRHFPFDSRSGGLTPTLIREYMGCDPAALADVDGTNTNSDRDEVPLTDAEWTRITAVCPSLPDDARPFISSCISHYRRLLEYQKLERRYEEAARLARKTAELIKRIELYRNDAIISERLRPVWRKKVERCGELVGALTLWTERFQNMAKIGKLELEVCRDPVRTLLGDLRLILRKLDRSKEVERLVATLLELADAGTKKKNIGWQIRTAIEEWRRQEQECALRSDMGLSDDELRRISESIQKLISDPGAEKKRS